MSDCLPHELITDILSRLPAKSLMRLRCVSKAWCFLISTPHFISTHLNRSLSNSQHQHPPCLFLSYYDLKLSYSGGIRHTLLLYLNQEIEQKWDLFSYPSDRIELRGIHPRIEDVLHLVGSSNGLLCLANRVFNNGNEVCVLWNPSIQKGISLPEPNIGGFYRSFGGFGYEPMTDDYKLVRLVYLRGTDHFTFNNAPPLVEIYTLRTGIWRSITAPGPPYTMKRSSSSVFVSGAVHWPAHTPPGQGTLRNVIVSFNMKDETFGELGMPESLQGVTSLNVAVAVVDGLLALVPWNEFGSKASQAVWLMKEYGVAESWTKLFDIDIGRFRSSEVLVNKAAGLFSFGPSSGRGYFQLPIFGLKDIYLDTYVESLVLLNVAD